LLENAKKVLSQEPSVKLDYLNICNMETGKDLAYANETETRVIGESSPEMLMSGAIWVGKTRLIDNVILTQIFK
jgi:pantothenate synthetase